jgi:hypothetical protein
MPKKELARERRTTLGRVVYDRPRHLFGDRDLYRITRSMLIRAGDQPKSGDYDLNLGAWLATIILTLLRAVFEWVEKTRNLKNFLLGLIFNLLPGIIQWALKYEDVYYRLLKSLWLWIGDILATGRPADKKEETEEPK